MIQTMFYELTILINILKNKTRTKRNKKLKHKLSFIKTQQECFMIHLMKQMRSLMLDQKLKGGSHAIRSIHNRHDKPISEYFNEHKYHNHFKMSESQKYKQLKKINIERY